MTRLLLALALLCATDVHGDDHDAVRDAVAAGRIKPLAEILAAVQARYPGRVLDVELERARDGRRIYDIELIGADGRKQDVHVDAATGTILDSTAEGVDPAAMLPLATVLRGVLQRHPGVVVDVELERGRDGRDVYEIELQLADGRRLELAVDAANGDIVDDDAHRAISTEALKPLPEILDLIAGRYPGLVVEVELERERSGRRFYEIDVRGADGRTLEVRVDAMTGEVLGHGEAD